MRRPNPKFWNLQVELQNTGNDIEQRNCTCGELNWRGELTENFFRCSQIWCRDGAPTPMSNQIILPANPRCRNLIIDLEKFSRPNRDPAPRCRPQNYIPKRNTAQPKVRSGIVRKDQKLTQLRPPEVAIDDNVDKAHGVIHATSCTEI